MKYLIFTDMHMSYTSSILPLNSNSKYTYRLQMCIDTFEWVFHNAKAHRADKIIFAGDLFDSHTLKSEELTALSEAMDYYNNIPMIMLTGNHDVLDNKSDFYASSIFKFFDSVTVCNKPTVIDDCLSVLPYMKSDDIDKKLLEHISNKVLISHIDLKGSHIRPDYKLNVGITPKTFEKYFNRVFNGHLHTAEKLTDKVENIGSCTSISFSDNNTYVPSVLIYDTESDTTERLYNHNVPVFRTYTCNSLEDLKKDMYIDPDWGSMVVRVKTKYESRDEISDYLSKEKGILAYRVITDIQNSSNVTIQKSVALDYSNPYKEFSRFLESDHATLKFPITEYSKVIAEVEGR